MRIVSINGIRQSLWAVACAAAVSMAAPAASPDRFKAVSCRALMVDPASALNLQRPHALRYRTAPLRVCVPDDTNRVAGVAFA